MYTVYPIRSLHVQMYVATSTWSIEIKTKFYVGYWSYVQLYIAALFKKFEIS